jgi:hypothetical protein
MLIVEFEKMLDVILPSASKTALTLTELPDHESQVAHLLESAIEHGATRQSRLTEIHLPLGQFPNIGGLFSHIPIMDSGAANIMRLFFEPWPVTPVAS